MSVEFIAILFCLLFSAFFSGMEIAFISSNKFRIELENKQGLLSAKLLSNFMRSPSRFISALLVGNNIALVIYGMVMAIILEPPIHFFITESPFAVLILQTIISTIIILIFAEFLPKALFRINPNRMLSIFAVPVWLTYQLLSPIVYVISGISELLLRYILRVKFSGEEQAFGRIDLDNYIKEVTANGDENEEIENEIKIFQKALSFSDIKVRECMEPRTEIIACEINDEVETLRQKFVETGLSKILIYKETIDNVIGYVHSFELFKRPEKIKSILIPILNVPESMPAQDMLRVFMQQHKSIALVVDEFGGTAGLVTMEDVVEEIFGEIEDEHDVDELLEKKVSDTEFEFSARLEIDYLNDQYNLGLPESEEYETLSGLIIEEHESIPEEQEEIVIGKFKFKILGVSETVIDKVKLTIEETGI